jgi:hypothetical protein
MKWGRSSFRSIIKMGTQLISPKKSIFVNINSRFMIGTEAA